MMIFLNNCYYYYCFLQNLWERREIFPSLTFSCCQSQVREQSRNNYHSLFVLVFIGYWEKFLLEALIPVGTLFNQVVQMTLPPLN